MKYKCHHSTEDQRKYLLKLLQKFEEFFNAPLGTGKTDPVDFE